MIFTFIWLDKKNEAIIEKIETELKTTYKEIGK